MKKKVIAVFLAASIAVMTGCYGTFTLTKKIYKWNGSLGDKFVNSLVMWALVIIPVYETVPVIDGVVLNTIEFWTGSNPLAVKGTEKIEQTVVSGDKEYRVLTGNNEIVVRQTAGPGAGQEMALVYDESAASWMLNQGGRLTELVSLDMTGAPAAALHYPDGRVELKELK